MSHVDAGKLALEIVKKNKGASRSAIVGLVYQTIMWPKEPLQCIVDAHLLAVRAGMQSGASMHALLNRQMAVLIGYISGQKLDIVRKDNLAFITQCSKGLNMTNPKLLHYQIIVLQEGLDALDGGSVDGIQTERELLASEKAMKMPINILAYKIHQLARAILFHQLDNIRPDIIKVTEMIQQQQNVLRPFLIIGIFFEGLASYMLSRKGTESEKWMKNGDLVLTKMKLWSEHSQWNWENKANLLEAEVRALMQY